MRRFQASSIVVLVLIASTMVAGVLAYHAINAARQRATVTEAVLRQYAQLATWEYSRRVRRDVESALMRALLDYAHPERRLSPPDQTANPSSCACVNPVVVEQWLEVPSSGLPEHASEPLRSTVLEALRNVPRHDAGSDAEGVILVRDLPGTPSRFVALKPEPHLEPSGGWVGLVAPSSALGPLLARAYADAPVLPNWLAATQSRDLVHVAVHDDRGVTLFSSPDTSAGPFPVEAAIWSERQMSLSTTVSMTPAFVAELGPEHGAGTGDGVVITLVVVNIGLVVVGLWQMDRERELRRLRDTFVAGVSHEMRTPLAQIRMFSEMLSLDRVRSRRERDRALQIIGQESTRLGHLVDNVLQFHRRTTTTAGPVARIDLCVLVADVAAAFEPLASSRRAHVVVRGAGEALGIRADRDALRQVLLNLLDNALKYGPVGQTITVWTERRADRAIVQVDDQGPGVLLHDRRRVFDPFERGQNAGDTGGAGIGLAVVRDIVSAHGGDVRISDAPGGGARVAVSLPLAPAEA